MAEPPEPAAPGPVAVLVAARDEEGRIGATVRTLREHFPGATIVVADDGSRDGTAAEAEAAGAHVVLRLPHRGKGQALCLAERAAPPGPLLLCDADLRGDLRPLAAAGTRLAGSPGAAPVPDLAIAVFARRQGGGVGLAKGTARRLIAAASPVGAEPPREPLSGQRWLSEAARAACFPVAAGFGVETRMTIDALRAGLAVEEVELELEHRATGRDLAGFLHRGRQLRDLLLAVGPSAVNHRGLRLPLVGGLVALAGAAAPRRTAVAVAAVAAVGVADDLFSGPERGLRGHLRAGGATTGVLKAVAIPAIGVAATGSLSGGAVVGLSANALNLLDTKPGRALKTFLLAWLLLRSRGRTRHAGPFAAAAVLLAPYDLREMAMLGDGGANALGAVLGLEAAAQLRGRSRLGLVAALAGLTLLGEVTSLGKGIERTPGLRALDRAWRQEQ